MSITTNIVECANCGYEGEEEDFDVIQGDFYCSNCVEHCENCGNACLCGELEENLNGNYLCINCLESEDTEEIIHRYGYKPKPKFSSKYTRKKLFMGMELEVEINDREKKDKEIVALELYNYMEKLKVLSKFYLKRDGSLSNGFEIVSHPFTLQYTNKLKIKQILKFLKKQGCISHDSKSCGLHIHLSKSFFSKEELFKMRSFFAVCKSELTKFSMRKSFSYCAFENYDFEQFLNSVQSGRYYAFNLNTGQNTIELRLFQGTLKYERLMACLEFCYSLAFFIKKVNIINYQSWEEYKKIIYNSHKYPYLKNYLEKIVDETETRG